MEFTTTSGKKVTIGELSFIQVGQLDDVLKRDADNNPINIWEYYRTWVTNVLPDDYNFKSLTRRDIVEIGDAAYIHNTVGE